ncbi:hypothetical protein SLE2022_282560 [Rubroshorea leprosula]
MHAMRTGLAYLVMRAGGRVLQRRRALGCRGWACSWLPWLGVLWGFACLAAEFSTDPKKRPIFLLVFVKGVFG